MITHVDDALRKIVVDLGTDCNVVFDAPTREWSGNLTTTAVNLFLYDIRQDLTRADTGQIDLCESSAGSSTSGWSQFAQQGTEKSGRNASHKPPLYFSLSYMATVWAAGDGQDIHSLLGQLIMAFARNPVLEIDVDHWGENLERFGPQATLELTQPVNESRALTELWTALDNTLMPFVNLKVVLPMETFVVNPVPGGRVDEVATQIKHRHS